MAGACRLLVGLIIMAICALLVHSEVSPGVSGPVAYLPFTFFRSPSVLPCPRLDVGSTVR